MPSKDGRDATEPYRVRVGGTWYWVDPTVAANAIEPGDTVVIYPVGGEAHLAVLQGAFSPGRSDPAILATLEGERFEFPADAVAALHLAAEDDEQ
jgi:hypothetical protein